MPNAYLKPLLTAVCSGNDDACRNAAASLLRIAFSGEINSLASSIEPLLSLNSIGSPAGVAKGVAAGAMVPRLNFNVRFHTSLLSVRSSLLSRKILGVCECVFL